MRSRREGDADKRAGKPERPRKAGGGTVQNPDAARQTRPVRHGETGEKAPDLFEQALRRENVLRAYERVVRNGGAPGVDGMTIEELMPFCRQHWVRIREELLGQTYVPQPVRIVEIPKPDGKGVRKLGIPTVLDRLIQQALLQILDPVFDPTFSEASYGFRPGRSAQQAVLCARDHVAAGYRWVVDLDLEKFFDRVNHDVLMSRVASKVKDKRVLRLIRRYLGAGMMEDGVMSPRTEGTPQGSPLSPLLSNVLLDDLDKELERRGHRFARYADDCNVYVRSEAAGKRVMASLERFLGERLRLKINRDKSAVGRPWERKFLGYSVWMNRTPKLKVSPQSMKRLKERLQTLFQKGRGRNLETVIGDVSRIIRGWVAYFRFVEVRAGFEKLDEWVRRKLRVILWRQWKKPNTRLKKLRELGLDPERAYRSVWNGRGPWWNAGARHMSEAVPTRLLREWGLVSFIEEHGRLQRAS
jgi:RNA-directed DNA polymerase